MDDRDAGGMTCTNHGTPVNDSIPSVHNSKKKRAKEFIRKISLFSLSESVVPDHMSPRTVLTIQQMVILIGSILLVIAVLQIPTILYFTNPPPSASTSTSFISDIDFNTCSVS